MNGCDFQSDRLIKTLFKIWFCRLPLNRSSRCRPTYQHAVSKLGNGVSVLIFNLFSISYALWRINRSVPTEQKPEKSQVHQSQDPNLICISTLRLCIKCPEKAKQSTGVSIALIQPAEQKNTLESCNTSFIQLILHQLFHCEKWLERKLFLSQ